MPNGRCYVHGGPSKGAYNLVWKPGIEATKISREKWLLELKRQGKPRPGGRKSGRWWKRPKDNREKVLRLMDDLIEYIPAGPPDRPVEEWTPTELLNDTARLGLLRIREIVSAPISEDMDLKEKRLIGDMGLGAAKLLGSLQKAAFEGLKSTDQQMHDWLKRIAEIDKKGKPTE